jgi:hypothetical protein
MRLAGYPTNLLANIPGSPWGLLVALGWLGWSLWSRRATMHRLIATAREAG